MEGDKNLEETVLTTDIAPVYKLDDQNKTKVRSQESSHSRMSKTENATNSHPLLYSPVQHFPDVIPEKSRNQIALNNGASKNDNGPDYNIEAHLNLQIAQLADYNETLPEFPSSPSIMKKSLLYDMPVEVSQNDNSDTENDKSVYEAQLSPNLQNVSLKLNDKEGNLNFLAASKKSNKLRKIKVLQTQVSNDSDVSSVDTNSDSLKSDDILPGDKGNDGDAATETESPEPIEPLSAAEERKHARHWQRMLLPDGEQRTIDMRVIEPYKRVLSHGGYLRASGHTAIVLFSACHLPDRMRVDYDYVMDNLFLYVLWTLERLVTEDYVLVYLHGGATRLPSFSWLKKCYQMVSRKLRKNLTRLYLVHPTLWIKTMLFMAKPFISSKFYRKLVFVKNLRELSARIPLETAAIPSKVKAYDSAYCSP